MLSGGYAWGCPSDIASMTYEPKMMHCALSWSMRAKLLSFRSTDSVLRPCPQFVLFPAPAPHLSPPNKRKSVQLFKWKSCFFLFPNASFVTRGGVGGEFLLKIDFGEISRTTDCVSFPSLSFLHTSCRLRTGLKLVLMSRACLKERGKKKKGVLV